MLGGQTACMCVSVDSSHENCSYHIHKYSCKFNGIQRPFLFYMNLQVVFRGVDLYSGSTYIQENMVLCTSTAYTNHWIGECLHQASESRHAVQSRFAVIRELWHLLLHFVPSCDTKDRKYMACNVLVHVVCCSF